MPIQMLPLRPPCLGSKRAGGEMMLCGLAGWFGQTSAFEQVRFFIN